MAFVSNLTRQLRVDSISSSECSCTSTSNESEQDWPCPSPVAAGGRRPSWQEFDVSRTRSISSLEDDFEERADDFADAQQFKQQQSTRHNTLTRPRTQRCNATAPVSSSGLTFVSPFASASSGLPTPTLVYAAPSSLSLRRKDMVKVPSFASLASARIPAPSPCGSDRRPSDDSVTSSISEIFSPAALTTPLAYTPASEVGGMTPFEAAFNKKLSLSGTTSPPPSPFASTRPSTRPCGEAEGSYRYARQQAGPIPMAPLQSPSCHSSSESYEEARRIRRRSVDVGTLVNARAHQKSGRTSRGDASASAFVPPDQLRAQRQQRQSSRRLHESAFAQHLTCILTHSLSLCAAGANEYGFDQDLNLSSSPENSPRSSISTDGQNSDAALSSSPEISRKNQRLASFSSVTPQRRLELIDFLSTWSFDANELDQDELCECACIIFQCFLQTEGMQGVDMARVQPLLISLRSAYHARNAYHNFAHAVDVLQACYSFLTAAGLAPPLSTLVDPAFPTEWQRHPAIQAPGLIGDVLRPMHVFALLMAAIGHDVGHPGLSNAYMVNARTPAAQVYNDKSVLENFHIVTLARMLKLHGFGHLLESDHGTTEFRHVLLAAVLATDMSRHFPIVGQLTELSSRLTKTGGRSERIAEDRLLLCSGLMKCADISNPTRPHKVAKQWSTALLEEWTVQAQIEAKFALPISVVILNPEEQVAQAKSQVGFINLFTQPLFDAMVPCMPNFKQFADSGREGRTLWESIVLNTDASPAHTPGALADVTPKLGSVPAFSKTSSIFPPTKSFSSRLPPHRAPRVPTQIDACRANALQDSIPPLTSGSASSESTSPGAPSFFDRSSSISSTATTATTASWLSPATVDEVLPHLGDEECKGDCSSVTAACTKCSRKYASEKRQLVETYFGSPVESGVWPPDPFRPRKNAPEPLLSP